MARPRILIVGGGFGGVLCARTLRRHLRENDAEIVLFNRENHLVFSPLLAEAVGSSLNLLDVVVPLRQLLPGVLCRTEEIRTLDFAARTLGFDDPEGRPRRLAYDHLVLACGSVADLHVVPGMADHAFALKTVGDAAVLRTHILEQLEKAEVSDSPERRRWYLTFLVVGGGFSGVEIAGEINDFVRSSLRFFRHLRAADVAVILLHARAQLLPEISPPLREAARRRLLRAGLDVRLDTRVTLATGEGVGVPGGFLPGGTIVCTIGNRPAPVVEHLDVPKAEGRLRTGPDLRLCGQAAVWAVGDCAHIVNARDGRRSPATGQFAERQGRQCAENLVRTLQGLPTRPFRYHPLGQLCSLGGRSAVAELFGLPLSGFWAWFTWRGVYLFKLPDWSRRLQVGFDWAWLLFFPRDLSHLRTDVTDRVTHAHYEPGDWVFRQGERPVSFYVIESGEVEVVRATPDQPAGEILAVLGAGNFFGEAALRGNQPRSASVRARTATEVVVMGRHVFTSISRSLAPLRLALAQALSRRSASFWRQHPAALATVHGLPLADFIEPVPAPVLTPATPLQAVAHLFATQASDLYFVSGDGHRLDGLITLTDLLRAQAGGASASTSADQFMTREPVALLASDSVLVAATVFREHGIKYLPVVADNRTRRLSGFVRARRLMARVLAEVPAAPASAGSPGPLSGS